MTLIKTLERIKRQAEFDNEAEAHQYLDTQAQEGFLPAAPAANGIIPTHGAGSISSWTVHVEKQIFNGVTTPAYREGDSVTVNIVGLPGWKPVEGTVTYRYGHQLKIKTARGEIECLDYEVAPIADKKTA